jgi:soluble lytic murein transglycosylase-like protein
VAVLAVTAAGCGGEPAPKTAPVADAPRPVARKIMIVVDAKRSEVMSAAPTVEGVLTEAKIALGPYDLVKPARQAPPGDIVKVRRLLSKPVARTVRIAPATVRKKNAKLPPFSQKVLREGRPGIKVVWIAYVPRKGKKVKAVINQKVRRKPVAEIVAIGPQGGDTGAAAGLNWAGLAQCESGGNPKAVNPAGYYGLYQFSMASWASAGGTGRPSDATPAEQTYRAQVLYNKVSGRWQGQWPHCGSRLFG